MTEHEFDLDKLPNPDSDEIAEEDHSKEIDENNQSDLSSRIILDRQLRHLEALKKIVDDKKKPNKTHSN